MMQVVVDVGRQKKNNRGVNLSRCERAGEKATDDDEDDDNDDDDLRYKVETSHY